MEHTVEALEESKRRWNGWGWPAPAAIFVSGSGLAVDLLPDLAGEARPLADLLPFPTESVVGHPLTVQILAADSARPILYQRGRLHSYQGHDAAETVFTVRLAALLGAEILMQTNAAGSLDRALEPGRLVALADHLNLIGRNPQRGSPPADWGPRVTGMSEAYDRTLRRQLLGIAGEHDIEMVEGVYAAVAGPSYETPAEVRMLRRLGADLVGMSTVLEVIAARHMGLRCAAISSVSNYAAGISDEPLDHDEVLETGQRTADRLRVVLETLARRLIAAAG
ncbi:MAG: purine-nucleoside phosphorylase [Thermoanaerobaculia bacterium]|nr:purine-nucleoside phosphorylase [Thermoanaerobaculia bacterium]